MKNLTNYEFVKVKYVYNGLNLDYGYVLKISNFLQLIKYNMEYTQGIYNSAFLDYAETVEERIRTKINTHFKNNLNDCIETVAVAKETSYIYELCNFSSKVSKGQIKNIEKFGTIYIQKVGSYFMKSDDIIEYDEPVFNEKCIFPDNYEIKISKWPGGKHWYAKIGNIDVVVNGNQKWNTYELAEKNAKEFLKTI